MHAGWGGDGEENQSGVKTRDNVIGGIYVPSARGSAPPARKKSVRTAVVGLGATHYIRTVRTPGKLKGLFSRPGQREGDMTGDMSLAKAMAIMSNEHGATPSSTFGDVGGAMGAGQERAIGRVPKKMTMHRLFSTLQKASSLMQATAPDSASQDRAEADNLAVLQRKRSAREGRARPWAPASQKKNRARLTRRNAFSKNIMLDVESLRAHIQVK